VETEALIRRLIRAGLATPEQLRGCSEADIEQIEATLGPRLPASYRDFLLAVGRNAGRFYATGHVTYPDLLGNRERANASLDEARYPFRLPTDAVIFLATPEGEFAYVRTALAEADPPVYHFMGLDGDPKPIAEHFTAFIERAIARYERPVGFTCCFCNQGVAVEGFDPCALTLRSFVHGPPDERKAQDFYCHAACFSAATHPEIRRWVLAGVRSD
jgi:hypothetical protein